MQKLRIFISSPGDVLQERKIAKNIIAELAHIYSNYVELETIMWEDLPLEATGSFQSGIDYFLNQSPIDIAVFILWSRLGSTLGQSYKKSDGSLYASGTEYEFDTMYELWNKTKKPRIIVYVKDAEVQFGKGLNSTLIKEALEQQDKLNMFIEEKFRDRETGTNYAYMQFDKQQTFEERLRSHLTRLIQEHIGYDVQVREWEGNPYVGLKSYEANESLVFCGRKGLTYDIIEQINEKHKEGEEPTLFILGESGSGKSSIVKAGILPYFHDSFGEERKYIPHIVCPSEFGGNIYSGIVNMLSSFYPGLEDNPILIDLKKGIDSTFKFEYLSYAIKNVKQDNHPILFIDQFEEVFSDNSISEEERIQTLVLLRILASTKALWIILSMRNDFYNKFTAYPDFGNMKNEAIVIDIPNVSAADILEIVEEPARKATLKWEINERGVSLSKQIVQDASEIRNLPLIEFALSELYNKCADTEILTFSSYESIGKLKGAVVNYADHFYQNLTQEEQKEFQDILPSIVTISSDKDARFVRKTALKESVERNSCCRGVVAKLITAHLLVSGKDIYGNSTISIVHEILITSWSVVKEWTKKKQQFLAQLDYYEKQARHWEIGGRKKHELIQERSSLLEAEYFMFQNEKIINPNVREFLRESLLTDRKQGKGKYLTGFIFLIVIVFSSFIGIINGTTGDKDMDETFGIGSVTLSDLSILYLPIIVVVFRSVWLRFCPKYKYQTIKSTSCLWALVMCLYSISYIKDLNTPDVDSLISLIFLLPFVCIACPVWLEYWRRVQWKNNRFVPFFITDKYETIWNTVKWIIIAVFSLFLLIMYGVVISEKNTKLEKATDAASECFDVLNNMQGQLSWKDKKYLNQSRMSYLRTLYEDELADSTPDEFEGKYGRTCKTLCL